VTLGDAAALPPCEPENERPSLVNHSKMRAFITFSFLVLLCAASCSKKSDTPSARTAEPAPAAPAPSPGAHVVTGTVPPAENGASAVVVLEPDPPRDLPPSRPAFLDQVNRVFTPDVVFARIGDPVEFRNSDDELHNINVTNDATKAQIFNVAVIPQTVYRYTFAQAGLYDVHCDIHQAMAALIVASSSPYAKVADTDGHVQFDDVQPGGYSAIAYAGTSKLEQHIEVSGPRTEIAIEP
jgi:hypothetical protein